jgi:SAM-dependent methyltransferase
VLRNLELEVLTEAEELVGVDIDRSATAAGRAHLAATDSRIQLVCGDLEQLEALLGKRRFDFAYAAGSLSYLDEEDAAAAVARILARTDRLAAFVGLARAEGPNAELSGSTVREIGARMWAHDFEAMVRSSGGEVLSRRWEPPSGADRQGLYFVFARPS